MKKICLVTIGLYLNLLAAFSQQADTASYKNRKLRIDEVNLVSSYYKQDGNNASVEGGIGSEKLTDIANVIDVKLVAYDKHFRKHSITAEVGLDNYTSASSDKVDLKANSSASSADTRIYPSLSWNLENGKTRNTFGLHVSASTEFDYKSFGFGAQFSKLSKDKNREIAIAAQVYLDKVTLIYPVELRGQGSNGEDDSYGTAKRNSYSGSISLSQVVTKSLQLMLIAEVAKQDGFLALPFHRVYLNDGTVRSELLPSGRLKIPIGLRANYFLGDRIVLRSFYRFYSDDWGLTAHTAELESSFKITPFFSLTPFYRFYTQTGIDYFAPYALHKTADEFYTSNYDLSEFNSNFFGAGIRFAPPKGVFGIKHWNMVEIRYGHYNRSTGLNSDIISLNLRLK